MFRELPVVGILRGFDTSVVERLARASIEGGLRNLEITMNSQGAEETIRMAVHHFEGRCNVGAGTVVTMDDLERALSAGAGFIVTPVVVPDVIRECVARGVPVMPGALTPTEVWEAWRLGADLVKIFPADQLGPAHIKALKGPFPKIPLMPTGGVTVETLPGFRKAGADAFGVGGPLFDATRAEAEDWEWFREQARRFVQAYQQS